jgi:hypothetical protein
MTINLHPQLHTSPPILIIQSPRLHRNLFFIIARPRCKRRTTVRAEFAIYYSSFIAAIQVQLGGALGVLEAGLWNYDVGGEAGAGVAFAVYAVAEDYLLDLVRWGFVKWKGDLMVLFTLGRDSVVGSVIRYAMLLQRHAPVK